MKKNLLITTDESFILPFPPTFPPCPPCFRMGEYQVFSIPLTPWAPPARHPTSQLAGYHHLAAKWHCPLSFPVGCARIWG